MKYMICNNNNNNALFKKNKNKLKKLTNKIQILNLYKL
jgi:hypothetical protein